MKFYLACILLILGINCEAQLRFSGSSAIIENVKFYKTTDDFLSRTPTAEDKLVVLKGKQAREIASDSLRNNIPLIMADKVAYNNSSLEKFREGERSWMLEFNGDFYFNLGYSQEVNSWGDWSRLDLVGKYCLIFIKPKSYLDKQIGKGYGGTGGLAGALTRESFKWGKNLESVNNEKMKVLFINTSKQSNPYMSRFKGSIAYILTKKDLRNLSELYSIKFDEKEATFEDVVDFVKKINNL